MKRKHKRIIHKHRKVSGKLHTTPRIHRHRKASKKLHLTPRIEHAKVKKESLLSEPKNLRDEREISMKLVAEIHKKFDTLIKATILFGSNTSHTESAGSDIDILIIIDDASIDWDLELISWYREELAKITAKSAHANEFHVTTIKLTTWWQDLLNGDPTVVNMLRYGEALIDIGGFFNPLKALLIQGKIHTTPEAVYNALQRAPLHLARSRAETIRAFEGIYWGMVDSAQSALMTAGKLPPSPEHITDMLKEVFVDRGLLKTECMTWFRDVFNIHKNMAHGSITHISGVDLDNWHDKADKFLNEMVRLVDLLLEAKSKG